MPNILLFHLLKQILKQKTEAITILFANNFCLGLLSSVFLASGSAVESEPVQIEPSPVYSTAINVGMVCRNSVGTQKETEETYAQEADVYETIEPDGEDIANKNNSVCFSEGFDSSFKAYMDYQCITDTDSVQYQLQQEAYTDERGFRRIGDDYCVALGTGITDGCSERFMITLDSGYSFSAIVSDVKADAHTDSTNQYAPRGDNAGNVVEFIIDSDNADSDMLNSGSAGCFDDLSGNVVSIEKITE